MVNVEIMEKHPTAIVLQIVNVGPLLRLDTQQAFEICKLIQHYQSLKLYLCNYNCCLIVLSNEFLVLWVVIDMLLVVHVVHLRHR